MSNNSRNIKISVVSPAYKCSECIEELYNRLVSTLEKTTNSFEIIFVSVAHSKRYKGKSSYSFRKMLNLAIDATISQSNKPLRPSIKFGFTLSLLSLVK
jgi:hypothetical protein